MSWTGAKETLYGCRDLPYRIIANGQRKKCLDKVQVWYLPLLAKRSNLALLIKRPHDNRAHEYVIIWDIKEYLLTLLVQTNVQSPSNQAYSLNF